jgi:hypothetical protein
MTASASRTSAGSRHLAAFLVATGVIALQVAKQRVVPHELWRAPGSSRVGCQDARREAYERCVADFFDRALLSAP